MSLSAHTYGPVEDDVMPYVEPTGELITQTTELAKQLLNNDEYKIKQKQTK